MNRETTTASKRFVSHRLVSRAIGLQLSDDNGKLKEIESLLLEALKASPDNIEALEEIAHFYDAVMADSEKAAYYANFCRISAAKLIREMDEILAANQ